MRAHKLESGIPPPHSTDVSMRFETRVPQSDSIRPDRRELCSIRSAEIRKKKPGAPDVVRAGGLFSRPTRSHTIPRQCGYDALSTHFRRASPRKSFTQATARTQDSETLHPIPRTRNPTAARTLDLGAATTLELTNTHRAPTLSSPSATTHHSCTVTVSTYITLL